MKARFIGGPQDGKLIDLSPTICIGDRLPPTVKFAMLPRTLYSWEIGDYLSIGCQPLSYAEYLKCANPSCGTYLFNEHNPPPFCGTCSVNARDYSDLPWWDAWVKLVCGKKFELVYRDPLISRPSQLGDLVDSRQKAEAPVVQVPREILEANADECHHAGIHSSLQQFCDRLGLDTPSVAAEKDAADDECKPDVVVRGD